MVVKEKQKTPLTIHISVKAADHVKRFAAVEGVESFEGTLGLRVGVKGGGCSGLTYVLSIANESRPEDKVIEENGVRIFVDRKSYVFLAGTTLDYSDGLNGKGFEFYNPQAKTTCGCGTSFSV